MSETSTGPWMEMMQCKDRFQAMVALLVEFDERTERYRKFGEPEQHFFRRAGRSAHTRVCPLASIHGLGGQTARPPGALREALAHG